MWERRGRRRGGVLRVVHVPSQHDFDVFGALIGLPPISDMGSCVGAGGWRDMRAEGEGGLGGRGECSCRRWGGRMNNCWLFVVCGAFLGKTVLFSRVEGCAV